MIGVFIFIRLYQGPEVESQAQAFIAKKWQHLDPILISVTWRQDLLTYWSSWSSDSNWGWFWPPGDLGNFRRHFWLSQLGMCGRGLRATDIWWVEASDANIRPHTGQSPQQLYGPTFNSAEAEKAYLREKVLSLSQENEDQKYIHTPTYTSRFVLNLSYLAAFSTLFEWIPPPGGKCWALCNFPRWTQKKHVSHITSQETWIQSGSQKV